LFAAGVEAGKFAAQLLKISEGHLKRRAKSKERRAKSKSLPWPPEAIKPKPEKKNDHLWIKTDP
jgi:hypothetical protein